ncbi:hypothetical protein ABEB36_012338 [Hypothenemus hampei]|uniref:Uncharacterized protein n=1 Tax=Hypothenemus hampei TaxID=57062 RepID=A0ABD1EDJ5_HYPHA
MDLNAEIKENLVFELLKSDIFICRFCLKILDNPNTSFSVFEPDLEKILEFCHIKLLVKNEAVPQTLCPECYSSLQNMYQFLNNIRRAESILDKYLFVTYQKEAKETSTDEDSEPNESPKKKHVVSTCKLTNQKRSTKSFYSCSQCNKNYRSHYELKIHERIHTGERPYNCAVCTKSFTDNRNLKKHEKIHNGTKEHVCSICERRFLHLFSLKIHARTHTGEKNYICENCGKSFNTSGELTIHFRIHSKEKPYSCSLCEKAFASKTALNIHTRIHTGDKRYPCTICFRKCLTSYDLKVHLRSHSKEKPYLCKYVNCSKSYRSSSQLNVHLRTHTGEKHHQCEICLKKFGEANTLKRHMIIHEKSH